VLTAIKKEKCDGLTDLYVREILSELAGMYMVLSADVWPSRPMISQEDFGG
jgi:hypothetical protein